ncbi:MAG TPA: ERCC4 domain-containing protein [Pirellulales bacterium]|nr:ERCC4 domain-containing protein [Pirellulales bacterium]
METRSDKPLIVPFTVVVDTREQSPFGFTGHRADAHKQYRPLVVPVVMAGLRTGDYSLQGFENRIAVERKSLSDAYSTFSQERDRFERELERLNQLEFAGVVIEAGWPSILHRPPPHTKFSRKSFFRSVVAWQVRFPRVHWWACETRSFAETVTLRWLERFWLDDMERMGRVRDASAGGMA